MRIKSINVRRPSVVILFSHSAVERLIGQKVLIHLFIYFFSKVYIKCIIIVFYTDIVSQHLCKESRVSAVLHGSLYC